MITFNLFIIIMFGIYMKTLHFQGEGDRTGCWMHPFQGHYEYGVLVRLVCFKFQNSYSTQPEGSRHLPLKGLNPEFWGLWRAPATVCVIWSYPLQKISWVLGRSVKMSTAQTCTESPVSHPTESQPWWWLSPSQVCSPLTLGPIFVWSAKKQAIQISLHFSFSGDILNAVELFMKPSNNNSCLNL